MEQRETEQRNGTNGIEMERILAWHGYHSPVPVGEGSFSQVYRRSLIACKSKSSSMGYT